MSVGHTSSLKRKLCVLKENSPEGTCDIDNCLINLTDTEAAISLVVKSEAGEKICRGALIHQLYAVLSNKTAVDIEIMTLRQNRGVKLLHFYLAGQALAIESQFVMLAADYIADLNDKLNATASTYSLHGSLLRFIPLATKYLDRMSILESDLLSSDIGIIHVAATAQKAHPSKFYGDPLSTNDVHNIVSAGFLCKRRDLDSTNNNVLWFAHPILAKLRQWIDLSRKEIVVTNCIDIFCHLCPKLIWRIATSSFPILLLSGLH